jgi:hypothetical protein
MSIRLTLLQSIAKTIETYRAGEIPKPTAEHVDRWVSQFTPANQVAILQEFDGVIQKSFYNREHIVSELRNLISAAALVGNDPAAYWRTVNFLSIQQHGESQRVLLELMSEQLLSMFGYGVQQCGSLGGDYMYLDDIAFTGDRAASDISAWIRNCAPQQCKLHVIFLVRHTSCYYMENTRIPQAIDQSGKAINVIHWYGLQVENRKEYRNNSGVYWPVDVPEEVLEMYPADARFAHVPRTPPGNAPFFSSEASRQLLESEFSLAGVRIRSDSTAPKEILKPLGYGNFGLGFGSTFATYRNCPNTAPLAIWWGNGDARGPFKWYPLLPRKI